MLNGFARVEWADGSRYQGLFVDHRMTKGQLLFPNGDHYDGLFDQLGHFDGEGTMTTKAEVVSGQWRNGLLNGRATRKTVFGDEYSGHWSQGKLNGEGFFQTKNERYHGEFKDDLEHGMGRKEFLDSSSWY